MTKRAILTGASSGIGRAMAPLLAAQGYELILVARRKERLDELVAELEAQGAKATASVHDLSRPEECAALIEEAGEPVDLLVNNAGYGLVGATAKIDRDGQLGMIDLNIRALTDLTIRVLPGMLKRGQGHVLNIASIVSFLPMPNFSVYCASKAYVLSFTESVDRETRGQGVRVQALCPGSTGTEFFEVARGEQASGSAMSAEEVARQGVALIGKGKSFQVAGLGNKLVTLMPRFFPRAALTWALDGLLPAETK